MRKTLILSAALCCILLCGCQKEDTGTSDQSASTGFLGLGGTGNKTASDADAGPVRDSTPKVLVPSADGTNAHASDTVTIDASNTDQGYIMVQYTGDNPKVKLQIETPGETTYTYLLSQDKIFETFPLSGGNGAYSFTVLENVEGDMYSVAFEHETEVQIEDEFLPFLYPNQYVSFTSDSAAVAKGSELSKDVHSDLEAITNIYHFVTQNIVYDSEKAASVAYGYLPDIDETLSTKKGICFDYAALTAAMLRSQRIPTRLEVGYAGDAYHAWISCYVEETGWIDNIIEFDGSSWSLMDPTFAAGTNSRDLKQFIGDGSNYAVKYYY